ncbi:putative UDP-Gal or UDP-GlcNAc-dependent glycosyltransferase [Trypanosoma grayi]|uniref:putative UDP-Gal or UDP-GlcNAc-dependent glycosyltransferase n=1 Tax=Trypanosoma grayi TaxID=71804 RepID=UPI0004F462D4|nr:putative UDP-Gal or UDP-GlcNAc-dependent glycosyltransferase [Trypanosoma grayi]KEG07216.1 putative UDP-Gal or UDP-GlcNAc-dependent glycosyltransferase [Trypanosoma grayi]
MLVLYVFGRHPSHNFTYSATLQQEAAEWHDVIALPMNEGRPSTNKTIGDLKWGNEAEIGLSRKVFLWFDMALRVAQLHVLRRAGGGGGAVARCDCAADE